MFKKLIDDQKYLYFPHYPPQSELDVQEGRRSNFKKPKEAYRGVPREENTVYYYWWAFLRLNRFYRKCCEEGGSRPLAPLYQDFGDVRGNGFIDWWKQHGPHCFAAQQRTIVHVFQPPEDLRLLEALDDRSIILRIDAGGDLAEVMRRVQEELQVVFERRNEKNPGRIRYVPGAYRLPALHEIYEVACALDREPSLEGELLAAAINADRQRRSRPQKDFSAPDQMRLLQKKYRQAKSILHHVTDGKFPVYGE